MQKLESYRMQKFIVICLKKDINRSSNPLLQQDCSTSDLLYIAHIYVNTIQKIDVSN